MSVILEEDIKQPLSVPPAGLRLGIIECMKWRMLVPSADSDVADIEDGSFDIIYTLSYKRLLLQLIRKPPAKLCIDTWNKVLSYIDYKGIGIAKMYWWWHSASYGVHLMLGIKGLGFNSPIPETILRQYSLIVDGDKVKAIPRTIPNEFSSSISLEELDDAISIIRMYNTGTLLGYNGFYKSDIPEISISMIHLFMKNTVLRPRLLNRVYAILRHGMAMRTDLTQTI